MRFTTGLVLLLATPTLAAAQPLSTQLGSPAIEQPAGDQSTPQPDALGLPIEAYWAFGGGYSPRWGDDDTLRQGGTFRMRAGVQIGRLRLGATVRMHTFNDWRSVESDVPGEAPRSYGVGWSSGYTAGLEGGIREPLGLVSIHAGGFVLGGSGVRLAEDDFDFDERQVLALNIGGELGIGFQIRRNFELVLTASMHALIRDGAPPTLVPAITLMSDWH